MSEPETEEERSARLREFVLDYCNGHIVTSLELDERDIPMVFMVLALNAEVPPNTAIAWEHVSKAGPVSINGNPTFFSCHFMNAEDWNRCRVAILAEMERRKAMKV